MKGDDNMDTKMIGRLAFKIVKEGTIMVGTLAAMKALELAIKNKGLSNVSWDEILELKKKG